MNTMVKYCITSCFWIISCFPALAQAPDWNRVHALTADGIESLYNCNFIEAEQKFDEVISIAPRDPRGYFYKSMIYGYRFAFMKVQTDFDTFMALSDKVITVSDEQLRENSGNSTALFYLGGIYGYRGVTRWLNGKTIGAFWDGRKGYRYLEEAIKADQNNYDARMGLGVFQCMLSSIPSSYRWLVNLAGFDGDRQKGIEQLELAAAKGVYAKTEALQWLSQFYQQNDDYEKSFAILDRLAKSYPDNPFYLLLRANALLFRLRRAEDAIADYNKVLAIKNSEAERFINAAHNYIGDAYRFQNKFSDATQSYLIFTQKKVADTALQSRAKYWIGNCSELMGNLREAKQFYSQSMHVRDAANRLNNPYSQPDISVIKLNNYFSAGMDRIVIDSANMLLNTSSLSEVQRSQIHLVLGQAYAGLDDLPRAKEQFDKTLSFSLSAGSASLQKAYLQRGIVFRKMGERNLARNDFEKALSMEHTSEEHWHRSHIQIELDKLK